VGAAVVAFVVLVLIASGQDGGSPSPTANLFLARGFDPDPWEVYVDAGGETWSGEAFLNQSGCAHGYVRDDPNVVLAYTEAQGVGAYPLSFIVEDRNVTIHVQLPDGSFTCNHPNAPGDPLVVVPEALSGLYHIWAGTVDGRYVPATLFISELINPFDDDEEGQAGAI
jgi:hypothetical protein